jgi:YHS domain-containing protein
MSCFAANALGIVHVSRRAVAAFALLFACGASAFAGTPDNAYCPVMTDSPASDEFTIQYRGRNIGFCCTECLREFQSNPAEYADHLPQLAEATFWEQASNLVYGYSKFLIGVALSALLVILRLTRRRTERSTQREASWFGRLMTHKMSPTGPLIVLLGVLGWQLWSANRALFFKNMEEDIHFATFYDYGYPPIPDKAGDKDNNRLAATYYRGNDERDERLFNGGNYCTAEFHVAVETESGRLIEYGQAIGGEAVFVVLKIDRPPHTPDFLFSDRFMKATFLTRACDPFLGFSGPVADRVDLTALQPMQLWIARYPLGIAPTRGAHSFDGVVYVCEEYYYKPHPFTDEKSARGGSRFHYGIPYKLILNEGRVALDSELWMGSLYRTRKFPRRTVPFEQWFSARPLPNLPVKQVEDPALLGIDDYLESPLTSD